MKEYDIKQLIEKPKELNKRIKGFIDKKIIQQQNPDQEEIKGHIQKAENNLLFVRDNLKLGYFDWCITGCYYASYHIVLALIMIKGFVSKSHLATLCLLIRDFYKNGVDRKDIELIDSLYIDYQDLIFYVSSKDKREKATYSSKRYFDKKMVESLRLNAVLFVDKIKGIIESSVNNFPKPI